MSAELQWLLIRNSSCFLVRRKAPRGGGVTFTKEPNNLTNKNAFKFNGLVNKKTIDITSGGEDKGVFVCTKRTKKINKPAKTFVKYPAGKERRQSYRFIRKYIGGTDYRQDLKEYAVRRASAIIASKRPLKRLRTKRKRR